MLYLTTLQGLLQSDFCTLLTMHQNDRAWRLPHALDEINQPRLVRMPRIPTHRDYLRADFVHLPIQINLHKPLRPFAGLYNRPWRAFG